MEFLVRIEFSLPPDVSDEQRQELLAAEYTRGRELRAAGKIAAIWRLPGGLRNIGVWQVEDATELHELLASLPLYRFATVDVTALAKHPLSESQ